MKRYISKFLEESHKITITIIVAVAIFWLDYSIELGVAGGVPYVILVLMGLWYRDKRVVLLLGATGIVLTIIGFYYSSEGGEAWKVLLNRLYAIVAIGVVAYFVYHQRKARLELTKYNLTLEQKVAERTSKLEKSNKELEEFAYVASHDMKAPLISIQSLLKMIPTEKLSEEADRDVFEMVKKNVGQLCTTVHTLNDVLAIKETMKDSKEPMRFGEVFTEVRESIAGQLETAQATISTDFSQCEMIDYPPMHLRSILQNLLTNAVKYKHPDKPLEVEVRTKQNNKRVLLTVKDNGLGFDADKNAKMVTGLFKRLHTHVEGKGVGMYIVNSIVGSHGGKIEMESEPNNGATFKIQLN